MLIQIWLSAFKTMIYLWGLVEQMHQKKVERHNAYRPIHESEAPATVDVEAEYKA